MRVLTTVRSTLPDVVVVETPSSLEVLSLVRERDAPLLLMMSMVHHHPNDGSVSASCSETSEFLAV